MPAISPATCLMFSFLIGLIASVDGCGESAVDSQSPESEAVLDLAEADADGWRPLFNGRDLTGWTPKIRFSPLGEDPLRTFRVEDGLLKVSFDQYKADPKKPDNVFQARFGHLFYETPFSNYDLRVEYRLVGQQCAGGAGWAEFNSGIMIHGQDPAEMTIDQTFPASIEVQLKAVDDNGEGQQTLRCCTPGTTVVRDGKLFEPHCFDSTGPKVRVGEWVTIVLEVRGNEVIRHKHDGQVVLEYHQPQLDSNVPEVMNGLKVSEEVVANWYAGKEKPEDFQLTGGTISLQSESHPVEFRRVEIRELE